MIVGASHDRKCKFEGTVSSKDFVFEAGYGKSMLGGGLRLILFSGGVAIGLGVDGMLQERTKRNTADIPTIRAN
jgi:hypothetical protein